MISLPFLPCLSSPRWVPGPDSLSASAALNYPQGAYPPFKTLRNCFLPHFIFHSSPALVPVHRHAHVCAQACTHVHGHTNTLRALHHPPPFSWAASSAVWNVLCAPGVVCCNPPWEENFLTTSDTSLPYSLLPPPPQAVTFRDQPRLSTTPIFRTPRASGIPLDSRRLRDNRQGMDGR